MCWQQWTSRPIGLLKQTRIDTRLVTDIVAGIVCWSRPTGTSAPVIVVVYTFCFASAKLSVILGQTRHYPLANINTWSGTGTMTVVGGGTAVTVTVVGGTVVTMTGTPLHASPTPWLILFCCWCSYNNHITMFIVLWQTDWLFFFTHREQTRFECLILIIIVYVWFILFIVEKYNLIFWYKL